MPHVPRTGAPRTPLWFGTQNPQPPAPVAAAPAPDYAPALVASAPLAPAQLIVSQVATPPWFQVVVPPLPYGPTVTASPLPAPPPGPTSSVFTPIPGIAAPPPPGLPPAPAVSPTPMPLPQPRSVAFTPTVPPLWLPRPPTSPAAPPGAASQSAALSPPLFAPATPRWAPPSAISTVTAPPPSPRSVAFTPLPGVAVPPPPGPAIPITVRAGVTPSIRLPGNVKPSITIAASVKPSMLVIGADGPPRSVVQIGTTGYLNVPTASGALTPNQAGLAAGTGTIDLRAELAPTSWASGAFQAIVNQYTAGGGAGTRFWFGIDPAGTLELDWAVIGSSPFAVSTVAPGFAAGSQHWVRALLNIAAGTVDFYTSTDGVSWTPLGTQVTGLNTSALSTGGTAPVVRIGTDADNEHCPGKVFHTRVIVGGSTVLNMDWTAATPGAGPWVAASGETWTALGTATEIASTLQLTPALSVAGAGVRTADVVTGARITPTKGVS